MFSRRDLLRWAGLLALPQAWPSGRLDGAQFACKYKARATVLMLSVPLLHRDNVGGGYLRMSHRSAGERTHLRLEFGAGSIPERAAGLDRLGVFEEAVVELGGQVESASYFGFMTASGERSLEQAHAALKRGGPMAYTAIRGSIGKGKVLDRLVRVANLAVAGWTKREELEGEIRKRVEGGEGIDKEAVSGPGPAPCTFLYAIHCALNDAANEIHLQRFVHNGEILGLRTQRRPERKGLVEIEGKIQSAVGEELSAFRVWVEPDSSTPHPVRFEFRPRSFLRLSFERV